MRDVEGTAVWKGRLQSAVDGYNHVMQANAERFACCLQARRSTAAWSDKEWRGNSDNEWRGNTQNGVCVG
jgi:hypothetical protein